MFQGSMVALVTPMLDNNEVDFSGLEKLVAFHLDAGTDAIVSVGTTGESATLDHDEHVAVIAATVQAVAGKIPVIAGTGANATREAIELTRAAEQAGADAALLVTPYYNKPTQEGLYQHYKAVAEAVALPQILYNVPGRTACDLLPETIARLADIENIVAVKEATGDLQRGQAVLDAVAGRMAVLSGDDPTAAELILLGAKGNISVTANVLPQQMQALCAAALSGDAVEARRLNAELIEMNQALFVESNPIPVKWALHAMGYIGPAIRLPLTPLAAPLRDELLNTLKSAGAL